MRGADVTCLELTEGAGEEAFWFTFTCTAQEWLKKPEHCTRYSQGQSFNTFVRCFVFFLTFLSEVFLI
jgi:hypothetical protein